MLEITVKTLDSQSRNFSVPDDITVQAFKVHIAGSVSIAPERQRLIYQGRVLQDDAVLNANGDMNGKVIHLVERHPTPQVPTPAEVTQQAQAAQVAQDAAALGNPPPMPRPGAPRAAMPTNLPSNLGNALGPFQMPGPGSNFNSGQLMQQMLQQALSGMSSPMGPTVVRGTVSHPNAPGGDSRTEIRIHIQPQQGGGPTQPQGPRPAMPPVVRLAGPPPQQQRPPHPQQVVSEPRRQLTYVGMLLSKLEEHITTLETGNFETLQPREQDRPSTSGQSDAASAAASAAASTSEEPEEQMDVETGAPQTTEPSTTQMQTSEVTAGTTEQAAAQGGAPQAASQTQGGAPQAASQPQGGAPQATSQAQAGDSAAGGPSQPQPQQTAELPRHPPLPEVAEVMRRLTNLEGRFLPFLTEYTDFLEKDPPFTSTESGEYKRMLAFITTVLKAQRALGIIHRVMSRVVIPLSETPPRSMLIQGCPVHRPGPAEAVPPPAARRVQNVATAGSYLDQPMHRPRQAFHRPPGPQVIRGPRYQVRVPFFGPFRPMQGMNVRPGVGVARMAPPRAAFGFSPVPLGMVPHQSGLYGPPGFRQMVQRPTVPVQQPAPVQQPVAVQTTPASASQASQTEAASAAQPTTSATRVPAPATTSTSQSVPRPPASSTPVSTNAATGPATHVEFVPPEYAIQVTTHIQPNISININPMHVGAAAVAAAVAAAAAPEVHIEEEVMEPFMENPEENIAPPSVEMEGASPAEGQAFAFMSAIETDEDGNVTMPVEMNIPNIPGVPPDTMRQIIQEVSGAIQQAVGDMAQGGGGSSSTIEGETTTQQSGRISVQGLPGGQNQIPAEVANIIGQTVQNVLLNHLTPGGSNAASAPAPDGSTGAPAPSEVPQQPAQVAPPPVPSEVPPRVAAPSTTTASNSARRPTGRAPASEPASVNMLAELLAQVEGGTFGTIPGHHPRVPPPAVPQANPNLPLAPATTAETPPSQMPHVTGVAGHRRRRLPPIRRVPNCVNDLVRGQGYPSEMMQLTGEENIISLLLFLCGELMTIQDTMAVMAGVAEPMNRIREPMRQALIHCWFDGRVPTRDEIEVVVEAHSDHARPTATAVLLNESPRHPDVSIVESNLSMYRYILRKILHLLFIQDPYNFAANMIAHITDCFAIAIHLNLNILRGTENSVTQLFLTQLTAALAPFTTGGAPGAPNAMVNQIRDLIGGRLVPFARSHPVSQNRIDQFVMNFPDPTPEPEPVAPKPKEAKKEPIALGPGPATSSAQVDKREEDKEKEEEKKENGETSSASLFASTGFQNQVVGNVSAGAEPEAEKMEDEAEEASPGKSEEEVAGQSQDWREMVPEEWVSVIESDMEKQKNLPEQPPYSEAYMAGMPASKRRKV